MDFFLSSNNSIKLAEWWCDLESNFIRIYELYNKNEWAFYEWTFLLESEFSICNPMINTFSFLNDICLKYAVEFFGESWHYKWANFCSEIIIRLIIEWKKIEAENFFMEKTIFNPKI